MILKKMLHPPKWILIIISMLSFAALIFVFATEKTESTTAYPIYCMSAYSLVILIAVVPKLVKNIKTGVKNSKAVKYISSYEIGHRYLYDLTFRGSISIYQGMIVSLFYMVFRIIAGIRYTSVWFISMAVYYLILGVLRTYLIFSYRHRDRKSEYLCYRRAAWMLFLLNVNMGGMIVLMIKTNSGFSYPGYIIYLSALYTFYMMIISIINLVKFRKIGSPILLAAKVLNFVTAMMSILGLQTAMISRFSNNGESYRRLMNSITGSIVYGIVIVIAIFMLLHSKKYQEKGELQ